MISLVGEGAGKQAGGDVDDGDDALVGHARRADDADRADDHAVDRVGGGDDAAFVERGDARFPANENLHALGAVGNVEQADQAGALLEKIKQLPQALGKAAATWYFLPSGEVTPRISM